jgi:hypothetical protein
MSAGRMADEGNDARNTQSGRGGLRKDERSVRWAIGQSTEGDAITARCGVRGGLRRVVVLRMRHCIRAQHQRQREQRQTNQTGGMSETKQLHGRTVKRCIPGGKAILLCVYGVRNTGKGAIMRARKPIRPPH